MPILANKFALVTGASRGIGAAIAKRLAREGAAVAITYVHGKEAADHVVQSIEAEGGRALAIQADAADAAAVGAAVDHTARVFGRIDVLVNSAGALAVGLVEEFALADFDRLFAINVRGVFVTTQAALRHMHSGGRIINIGSCNAARMPFAGGAAYAMTKSALVGLVQGMARDLGPRGITVNNVQPGPTESDMNPKDGPASAGLKGFTALGRFGTAEEIAGMVAYLAGPESGFVTGASLTIDGGFNA